MTSASPAFLWALRENLRANPIPIENLLLVVQLTLIAITMATRRPPTRVTHNPLFWLLAFVATYWAFFMAALYQDGRALVPRWISVAVAVLGLIISIWARLSLGRNIGFVPAERQIVTTGAYGLVRHPIYTGLFVGFVADDLANFTAQNLALDLAWVGLWVLKTFIEEGFLKQSPAYTHYMTQVRRRWIPGIA